MMWIAQRPVREIAPPSSAPASDWIMEISSASHASSAGNRPGKRWSSIDLPAPGGPIINKLSPPAAAISSARLALSWPLTSCRSGALRAGLATRGSGGDRTLAPFM